jgi:hypothetical protein
MQYMVFLAGVVFLLAACSGPGARLACATILRPVCLPISIVNMGADIAVNSVSRTVAGEGNITAPVHGKWCGPGHPKNPDSDPEPEDALDAACRRHDLCYSKRGNPNCKCDQDLVKEIAGNRDPAELSVTERAIVLYFRRSYCPGCKQTTVGSSTLRIGKCAGGELYRRTMPW